MHILCIVESTYFEFKLLVQFVPFGKIIKFDISIKYILW